MSVYIEGMEMPKGGFVEILIRDDGTVQQTGQSYRIDGTDYYTPYVVEMPVMYKANSVPEPHGRLGDLDALMLKIREYIDEYGELDENGFHSEKWCAMKEAEMVICEAPTVIQASEEG